MTTLKINTIINKDNIIKEINKFRLQNKNKWYQIELHFNEYLYKMKCFDTWVQLNYIIQNDNILYNEPSSMDLTPSKFKQYLNDIIR